MYMQPDRPIPPKNYSGSAFAARPIPPPEEPRPAEPPPDAVEAVQAAEPSSTAAAEPLAPTGERPDRPDSLHETPPEPDPPSEESVPASARAGGGRSGFLSRFPLLSSFLPPPRHCEGEKERGLLPDWVLLGAMALLFLADEDNDILPFLLLLLLWD